MPWDFLLIFLFLIVALPLRGRLRIRQLLAKPQVSSAERLGLYAATIAFQWLLVAVTAWRCWVRGLNAAQLGLAGPADGQIFLAAAAGTLFLGILHWLNLRRIGHLPSEMHGRLKEFAERVLPRTAVEMLLYFALSLTAAVCEEFLYRGFAMAVLARLGWPVWVIVIVTAAMFGLAHLYQGRGGVASTCILGFVFGAARIAYDSLVPVIIWHAAVDVIAGIAGRRYLLPTERKLSIS